MVYEGSSGSFDKPVPAGGRVTRPMGNATWLAACLLLLGVTWLPLLGTHLYKMSRGNASTGAVIVVFPPTLSSSDLFRKVSDAGGSMVKPVPAWRHAWIVQSLEPGFAGRLRDQGAWGVFSPDLLSPEAFLNCFRVSPGADPTPS